MIAALYVETDGAYFGLEARRVRPKEAARTPDAFRDVLLDMARSVVPVAA